jgi:hypothetical protein
LRRSPERTPWPYLLLLVGSLLLLSCSAEKPPPGVERLIGTWEAVLREDTSSGLVPIPQMTFVPDGTYFLDIKSAKSTLHEEFAWQVESEDGAVIHVSLTNVGAAKHEKLKIRFLTPDKLRVEGKEDMIFRRVN